MPHPFQIQASTRTAQQVDELMIAWGDTPAGSTASLYLPGVAAADIPESKSRGKETFFDGKVFDPENPAAYLKSLSIKRVEV